MTIMTETHLIQIYIIIMTMTIMTESRIQNTLIKKRNTFITNIIIMTIMTRITETHK